MTEAILIKVSSEVELFKLEQGRYPASLQDLVRRPVYVDPGKWPSNGYIEEPCVDGWGRPLVYTVPGTSAPFDIVSWGEDGKPGGEGVDTDLWSHPFRTQ